MTRALRAAASGGGEVSPNPRVGAAIRDDAGRIRTSYHARFGGLHAEARLLEKLARLGADVRGREVFVTLEPCSHEGKTPACARALVEAAPASVQVAVYDPDPRVSGRGVALLRAAGIPVEVGMGERDAIDGNLPFFLAHAEGRSSVELKLAVSLDGRIATQAGESQWISGEPARRDVHASRADADAVLIGSGTARADDPELTVRKARGPQPSRIVVDSELRTNPAARVREAWNAARDRPEPERAEPFAEAERGMAARGRRQGNYTRVQGRRGASWVRDPRLVLATRRGHPDERLTRYRDLGWEVWTLPDQDGRVDLRALLRRAREAGLYRIYAEAGPGLAGALLSGDWVDRLSLYQAPVVLGGDRSWSAGVLAETLESGRRWSLMEARRIGDDLRVRYVRMGLRERLLEHVHRIGRGDGPRRSDGGDS